MMRKLRNLKSPFIIASAICLAIFLLPLNAEAFIFNKVGNIVADTLLFIPGWLSIVLLQILSLVLYLSGVILNFVMNYTVVNMADNIAGAGVNSAWATIRDIGNMGFIFILLTAAIQLVLGVGKDTQRLIKNVIIVALLINFSLFFTKVVIDASNILAVTFYGAIAPGALDEGINRGLANSLMEPLKIQTLAKEVSGFDGSKAITVGILGSVFVLAAAFIFFAISILFVIRFVVLIFVLILSPIAFLALILPQLKGSASKWKDALIGQAFFAPIFMMLMWVVISVSRNLHTSSGAGGGSLAGAITGSVATGTAGTMAVPSASDIGLVVNFLVVIALLITALTISKDWANKAGGAVSSLNKWAMGAAGGATMGAAGYGARRSLGAKGRRIADDERLKDMAANKDGKYSRREQMLATLKIKSGQKLASSSFDARSSKAMGMMSGATGISMGKGWGKGGYDQRVKDEAKKKEEYAKSLEPSDIVKDEAKANLNAATKKLNDARQEEIDTRNKVRESVEQTFKKPEALERLERSVATAEAMSRNRTMSESARELAREQAIKLRAQALPIQQAYELRKEQRIEAAVSSSGVRNKISNAQSERDAAQAHNDKINGISPEEKKSRKESIGREEAEEIKNNPEVRKEEQLTAVVNKLTADVEAATGSLKSQLQEELRVRMAERDIATKQAEIKRKQIRENYDQQRKIIDDWKSVGESRKQARAESMANPGRVSPDRVMFVGMVSQSSKQAAANIRKGKKSVKDTLEDLLKEAGDIKKDVEEATEGSTGNATPGGTPPTTT